MRELSWPILLPFAWASFVCVQIINARVSFTPSKSNGTSCVVMWGAGPRPQGGPNRKCYTLVMRLPCWRQSKIGGRNEDIKYGSAALPSCRSQNTICSTTLI